MKNLLSKSLSLLLVVALALGMLPAAALAENSTEDISVTLRFDALVIAEDMDQLYSDLKSAGIIDEETTGLPGDITVTVPAGSTVKDALDAAMKKMPFTAAGIDTGFITQIGPVSSEILGNLVDIEVGNYYAGNVFSSAGWSYDINGVSGPAGISNDKLTEDNTVVDFYYSLYASWDSSTSSMVYYDRQFLNAYHALEAAVKGTRNTDLSSRSDTDQANIAEQLSASEALLKEIYDAAVLSGDAKELLEAAFPHFHTAGGMWIGYYEAQYTSLWGSDTSPTERLKSQLTALNKAVNPPADNILESLSIGPTALDNLITFSPDTKDYVVVDYPTKAVAAGGGSYFSRFLSFPAKAANPNSAVSVTLNGAAVTGSSIYNLDWSTNFCYVLTFTVSPPEGSANQPGVYTVKLYGTPTDAKLLELAEVLLWDTIRGLNTGADNVTSPLSLPTSISLPDGIGTVSAAWTSTPAGIINADGSLNRPDADTAVTLTAALSSGNERTETVLPLTVKALTDSDAKLDRVETLMANISKNYVNDTDMWTVMDMSAYQALAPNTSNKTTAAAKQQYINTAIASLSGSTPSENDCSKAIIALQSIGADPRQLYAVNSSAVLDAVALLNGQEHSPSPWSAPYVLFAYNQGSYASDDQEKALIQALLNDQTDDGAWDFYGTIDTTANVLAGLSFYLDDAKAAAAVDKAVNYLSRQQAADGSFVDSFSGSNANSTAMVIIGLTAVGVNPDTDPRFVKSGNSVLDGLLRFALSDNSGFGFTDDTNRNALATEQSFRSLISAWQLLRGSKTAYNVYDFSANTVSPVRATGNGSSSGGSATPDPDAEDVHVIVTIKADTGYWLRSKAITIKDGSSVAAALIKAISGTGITQTGAENGYVSFMYKDGRELGQFTNGKNSGWLYKLNGNLPNIGVDAATVTDGDEIVFYYTNDWTRDPQAGHISGSSTNDNTAAAKVISLIDKIGTVNKNSGSTIQNARNAYDDLSAAQKKLVTNYAELVSAEEAYAQLTGSFTDISGHWGRDAIAFAFDKGLMNGVGGGRFDPDGSLSRAMIVTMLWQLEGSPVVNYAMSYSDVDPSAWYGEAVRWASAQGVVQGYGDGIFAPNGSITREQLATMLYNYARYKEYDLSIGESARLDIFTDAGTISDYAEAAIRWACGSGLISGRTESTIVPAGSATRAEAAALFQRFDNISK